MSNVEGQRELPTREGGARDSESIEHLLYTMETYQFSVATRTKLLDYTVNHLRHSDRSLHAGALVRLAVEAVGAGGLEGLGEALSGCVQVVLVVQVVNLHTGGDLILVEHDVVGETLVVHKGHGLPSGDAKRAWGEDESAIVSSHLDLRCPCGRGQQQAAGGGEERLSDVLQGIAAGHGGPAHGRHADNIGGGDLAAHGDLGVGLQAAE
jgi:hypothetical protein